MLFAAVPGSKLASLVPSALRRAMFARGVLPTIENVPPTMTLLPG